MESHFQTYTQRYFTLIRGDILTRIALTAQKYLHVAIRFVQESKYAARTASLIWSTLFFWFIFLYFLVFPLKKAASFSQSAAHTADPKDLPKQPRGFNYLINLSEGMTDVSFHPFIRRSKICLLQHRKSFAACPAQTASLIWKQRSWKVFTIILGEASWSFTKIIFSSKLNDKGKG